MTVRRLVHLVVFVALAAVVRFMVYKFLRGH